VGYYFASKTKNTKTMKALLNKLFIGFLITFSQFVSGSNNAVEWKFQTGGNIYATPVIDDGIIYIGSVDSCLYAINAGTHEQVWKYHTTNEIRTTVAIYDSILCFASGEKLIGLSKSGNLLWEFLLCSQPFSSSHDAWDDFNSSPLLVDSIAYVGSDYGLLFGVNVINGDTVFHYQSPSGTFTIETKPVYYNGKLYVGDWDGVFYCIDVQTAETMWSYDTKNDNTYGWVNAIETNSVIYEDQILFAGRSCNLYSLNLETGSKKWMYHDGSSMWILGGLMLKDTLVFAGSSNQFIFQCFNVKTGSRLWTVPVDYRIYGSPCITDDFYFVGTGMETADPLGSLFVIQTSDNSKIAKIEVGGQVHSSPVMEDSTLYFGCADGFLYASRLKALLDLKYPHTYLEDNSVVDLGELPLSEAYNTSLTLINDGDGPDSLTVTCTNAHISMDPVTILLESGASTDVQITIDVPNINAGNYTVNIMFKSHRALEYINFYKRYTFEVANADGLGIEQQHLNEGIGQNYPNPFSMSTTVPVIKEKSGHASLNLYDARGSLISVLFDTEMPDGKHEINFSSGSLPEGLYLCKYITDTQTSTIRMQVAR
jgi:eukaryotic-like serine/threonine-protein kinase